MAPNGGVELDEVTMVEVFTESFDHSWWHLCREVGLSFSTRNDSHQGILRRND